MASTFVAILLLSLAVVSIDASRQLRGVSVDAPDFCHDADCPKFTLKEETDEYEIRDCI
jgi:hypothetical protein